MFSSKRPQIYQLEKKKDVRGLIKALKYKEDVLIQQRAAKALGDLRPKNAINPLIKALADSRLQRSATLALSKYGERAAPALKKNRFFIGSKILDVEQTVL